eukprot:jgi/Tetstr1/435755/TSEL_024649.t1
MDTDRFEEQHDAGAGTSLAALRAWRQSTTASDPHGGRNCKKIASTQIPPATCRHIRVPQRPSHLLVTGLPTGTDDAAHVALLFGDLVAQNQTMDEESRDRTVTNLIRNLCPEIGVQILRADVRVGVLSPSLSKQFFHCALAARAICTGPLANLELPTVEQLAEAIEATISQRVNTPPEPLHAQWQTGTMMAAGVDM